MKIISLAALAIWILFNPQNVETQKAKQKDAEAQNGYTNSLNAILNRITEIEEQNSRILGAYEETKKQEAQQNGRIVEDTLWLIRVNATQGVILLVTAIFIGYQAVQTKRAAEGTRDSVIEIRHQVNLMERQTGASEISSIAAKETAEATKQSIEVMITKERSRLRVDLKNLSLTPKFASVYFVDFIISAHGSTAAYIVDARCTAAALPLEHVGDPEVGMNVFLPVALPTVILPNSVPVEPSVIFHYSKDDADIVMAEIKNDRLFVTVRGVIKYKDVFDRARITSFRYVWKYHPFSPIGKDNRVGSWEKCGAPEDNCET
jgi:hypothetical protein